MNYQYEIRNIDAWNYDGEWSYNDSYKVGEFTTKAQSHKRAFLNALHKIGVVCKQGACYVHYDGDIFELRNRKTDEPLFCAIPMNF